MIDVPSYKEVVPNGTAVTPNGQGQGMERRQGGSNL